MTEYSLQIHDCRQIAELHFAATRGFNDPSEDRGILSHRSYHTSRILGHLAEAIAQYRAMLKEMPRDDPCYAACCCLLGIAYYDRYENLGAFADLELFLANLETALNLTPQDDSSWAVRSRTMVIACRVRYSRTGDPSDRKRAMDKHQECLRILSLDDPDSASSLAGLAQGYYNQYLAIWEPEDLKRAIHHQEAALERLPADESLGGINLLRDLGSMYLERSILPSGSMSDVDKAIEKYELALEKTPEHHTSKARQFAALGVGYYNKYQRGKDRRYIEKALEQERQAFNHTPSHVGDRLESGVLLLRRCSEVNDWSQAYEIAVKVLAWVPQIMHRFLDNSDKQSQLGALVGVASDAAAIALSAGKPAFEALRLVEIGRGIIAGSMNDMRLDVSTLEQQYPELAKEYTTLRDRILALKNSSGDRVDERYTACEKLEQVIKDIQDRPGFDRFHGELSEQESMRAAEHGPVVIVNVSEIRCDALIIEKFRIYTVQLPELDHYEAQEFATGSLQDRNILEWLWRTIAEPVLDALGWIEQPLDGCWPRIWWVPTGPLTRFPIHAAGVGFLDPMGSNESVLDRAISSYSTSLKALFYAHQHRSEPVWNMGSTEVVLVGMENTPGSSYLPFAGEEVDRLEDICNLYQLPVQRPPCVHQDLLSALDNCSIFHFAGHGRTDSSDPSRSGILLQDWRENPLTVADLLQADHNSRRPFLAYLSACGTGRATHDELEDESIHLISAFQLVGFQHVIGTLWEVQDEACLDVTTQVYQRILAHKLRHDAVSEGLHHAARYLRDKWIGEEVVRRSSMKSQDRTSSTSDQQRGEEPGARDLRDIVLCEDEVPLWWVPYVHYGI